MTEIIFKGDVGRLHGRYTEGTINKVALVLSPHPEYGGDMDNNICRFMYSMFIKRGYSVLQLNYRGVGRSEGEFDSTYGETTDANMAVDWLLTNSPASKDVTVCGFSFGAYIATQIAVRRPEVSRLISVSQPFPLYNHEFTRGGFLPKSLFVSGSHDQLLGKHRVDYSAEECEGLDMVTIEDADHFMNGKLPETMGAINHWLG